MESICSKCGDVWHVIVAMVGDQIAKVQCKECGAVHRHRTAAGTRAPGAAPMRRRTTGEKPSRPASPAPPPPSAGPAVVANAELPVRAYAASVTYAVAERIEHPSFGIGIVEAVMPGKITVFFASGRRVLAGNRPASMLAPPPRIEHAAIVPAGKPARPDSAAED
ncbi:MAG TPA: hypothetical protein VL172_07775 [Kofleriaceae bacterium]|nr:hypothetical protein [Kofleriaceae bacterium]